MAEPSLQEVFGSGATQTASVLTISKADLQAVGLTPSANNSAESLFVALLLLQTNTLTTERQSTNPEQSITIEAAITGDSLVNRNNQSYRQSPYTVNLQTLDTFTGIDPDDY